MPQKRLHPDQLFPKRGVAVRLNDFYEIYASVKPELLEAEAEHCMNCGSPFCQSNSSWAEGCPINNRIPEWNALVGQGRWQEAYERLQLTNNFPEFTGRICPAPCQEACIHEINGQAIQIKSIEKNIIDRAFEEGWVKPRIPKERLSKKIAIIGSGPAGLSAADQLNQSGYRITVFERAEEAGGLLMYGVPNMKLDKEVVRRRLRLLEKEGIEFRTGVEVGRELKVTSLQREYDAILLATGATRARELMIPGAASQGVIQAMPYLTESTQAWSKQIKTNPQFDAKGKRVVIIGAGDTATDCMATALRQGCEDLICLSRSPQASVSRPGQRQWPAQAGRFTVDYGHCEAQSYLGIDPRHYEVMPQRIHCDQEGQVTGVELVARTEDQQISASLPADLVILAMGFTGSESFLANAFGVKLDESGSIATMQQNYQTNVPGVFVAGDARRGASLVVWAIREGREAAQAIHQVLSKKQSMPVEVASSVKSDSISEHRAA